MMFCGTLDTITKVVNVGEIFGGSFQRRAMRALLRGSKTDLQLISPKSKKLCSGGRHNFHQRRLKRDPETISYTAPKCRGTPNAGLGKL